MGHYKSNVRDIAFNLFEVFGLGARLGRAPFETLDEDTVRTLIEEAARLAEGPLAESFAPGDRLAPQYDPADLSVELPSEFKAAYRAWRESGLWRTEVGPVLGGVLMPRSVVWAVNEQILGANPALYVYFASPFAEIVYRNGTPEQQRLAHRMIEREWGGTMVLTEPDAGTDVGAGRTKAIAQPDGSWHIEGVKRFITGAEHDLSENIVHLVLARPEGAVAGTKGLSLFVVPKFHYDPETGELGERNGVYVTNVEHKMGMTASVTCELRFGEIGGRPAQGWLLGEAHDGIAQMFQVIEHARMMVGTKAITTLSTGYRNAVEYALTRVQSADLTQQHHPDAPRVTIVHHPDVRRSLMLNKAYAEGLRALVYYAAALQDRVQVAVADGSDVGLSRALNDLLLPVVKGVGSERSYEQLAHALQIFGGSGYLRDYPLEQYIRDAKIDTLYEGTTAVQAQDFFFRKIVRNKQAAVEALLREIEEFAAVLGTEKRLVGERAYLEHAVQDVRAMVETMLGQFGNVDDPRSVYLVGQNATRLLMSFGDLLVGYLLLRQAVVAYQALDGRPAMAEADRLFYTGKPAVARFFAKTVLPELAARRVVVGDVDNELMDVPEGAL